MKKVIKQFLHRLGVLGPIQSIYFNALSLSPGMILHEIRLAVGKGSDPYPLPPPKLVFDVIACSWRSVYITSGQAIVDDMESILLDTRRPLSSAESILDFGCGCGRLARQFPGRTTAAITGSDYNPDLIGWCHEHLPFGTFVINELLPPTEFEKDQFDLIIARSVFTHLPEAEQKSWMAEFQRILRPGGYIYLTMHGTLLTSGLSAMQKESFEKGNLVVTYAELAGENICSTYASERYVENELLDGYKCVSHVEGRTDAHLRQDIYILEKRRSS